VMSTLICIVHPQKYTPFPYTTLFRSALIIQHHVFQHRTEADGLPNLRFLLPGQADAFCVTAPFDVEDSPAGPPVFIIPDQAPLRSEEHTSELQSRENLVCRLLLEKEK